MFICLDVYKIEERERFDRLCQYHRDVSDSYTISGQELTITAVLFPYDEIEDEDKCQESSFCIVII